MPHLQTVGREQVDLDVVSTLACSSLRTRQSLGVPADRATARPQVHRPSASEQQSLGGGRTLAREGGGTHATTRFCSSGLVKWPTTEWVTVVGLCACAPRGSSARSPRWQRRLTHRDSVCKHARHCASTRPRSTP